MYMHNVCHIGGGVLLLMGLATVLYAMVVWWRDVIREATFEGHHNASPSMAFGSTTGLRYGMLCFIASEVMFFVAFFWALFHSSLAPKVEMGDVWPPKGISVIHHLHIPFLNTLILFTSGAAVTWAHHTFVVAGSLYRWKRMPFHGLALNILLALIFSAFQAYE